MKIGYILLLLTIVIGAVTAQYDLTYNQDLVIGDTLYHGWDYTSGIENPCPSCVGFAVTTTLAGSDSVTLSTANNNNWYNLNAGFVVANR